MSLSYDLSVSKSPIAPDGMVHVPAGEFLMGGKSVQSQPDEFSRHKVTVSGFFMDETEVTNRQFSEFVEETGYMTLAERAIDWKTMKQ
ncbi:MAG: SUMF1/EgtB/PvdO family nonheme iron enzyme [Bacteroidota bacterium]